MHHKLGEKYCSQFAVESSHICSLLPVNIIKEERQNPEEGSKEVRDMEAGKL